MNRYCAKDRFVLLALLAGCFLCLFMLVYHFMSLIFVVAAVLL